MDMSLIAANCEQAIEYEAMTLRDWIDHLNGIGYDAFESAERAVAEAAKIEMLTPLLDAARLAICRPQMEEEVALIRQSYLKTALDVALYPDGLAFTRAVRSVKASAAMAILEDVLGETEWRLAC